MATDYKYDVFISYSRDDYEIKATKETIPNNPISAIKDAFDKNDITYWFDEEGIYSGQAFVDIITEAISVSKAFVFISSKHSNHSKWTKSEILEAFDSDKTIIPFKIDNTDYDKSLKFFLRPLDFISYFENEDNAIEELIRSVQKVKDEIAEAEKREKAEAEQIRRKNRIKELVEDYQRLSTQQETILSEIYEHSRLLGLEAKSCPVCGKSSKIDNLYCDRCGWIFHPLFAVDETYPIPNHKVLFSIFKTQWMSLGRITEDRKKLDVLALENEELKEQLKEIDGAKKMEIKALIDENNVLQHTLHDISRECEQHIKTIQDKADEADKYSKKAQMLSSENEQLQKEVKTTKNDLVLLTSQNEQLKQNLTIVSKECNETRKEKESEAKMFQEKYSKLAESESHYKKIVKNYETKERDFEKKITTLQKKLTEQTKLREKSEQELKQFVIAYQDSQEIKRESADKLSSENNSSEQKNHKTITKEKVTNIILSCRVSLTKSLFPQDKTADTIQYEQLKNNLESYGINLSITEFYSCKTIEDLKEAIYKKADI